jgi:hypothetical protein
MEAAMLGGLLKWIVHGDAPEAREPTPRERLVEARDQLQRQIAILEIGPINPRDRTPETARMAAELRHALEELDGEIADLDQ